MVGSYSNVGDAKNVKYWWQYMCEAQILKVIVEDMSGEVHETRSFMEPGKCEDKRKECESWTTEHTVIQSTSSNVTSTTKDGVKETSENESPVSNASVAVGVIAVIVIILVAVAVFLAVKLRNKTKKVDGEDGELNALYGTYYMGDGDQGEETDIVRVEDRNVYYSSEEPGDVVLHDNNEHYTTV